MGEVAVFMLQVLPAPARPFGMPPLPFQLSLLQDSVQPGIIHGELPLRGEVPIALITFR